MNKSDEPRVDRVEKLQGECGLKGEGLYLSLLANNDSRRIGHASKVRQIRICATDTGHHFERSAARTSALMQCERVRTPTQLSMACIATMW